MLRKGQLSFYATLSKVQKEMETD
ncbi:hypothetical protein XBFFL1_2530010 [Xenorhabdus bovienii str. feltiae Florida]|uniref:Uncharacterized protein n=1 Tax=Xenorhabdus bovienii str. feltiae Moldova TaxID=1398200 RepID=A0A077NSZ9_XENBV|nr:hypothetical protein XBFFR1_2480009 [Xenorhabdus bovienii str. feltiae France]CDG93432.1 hypothetical protein XBFFL1_2530010 [Xenorhabdus bovienii str. feltiae Florida]CDH01679.1 hypothetical protein XBFM1_2280012 [Xenorhabdus bovienii str. feltiae Moldova]